MQDAMLIESDIKCFCRLAVSNANPSMFEVIKRWGLCLTASLRHSDHFNLYNGRLNSTAGPKGKLNNVIP